MLVERIIHGSNGDNNILFLPIGSITVDLLSTMLLCCSSYLKTIRTVQYYIVLGNLLDIPIPGCLTPWLLVGVHYSLLIGHIYLP